METNNASEQCREICDLGQGGPQLGAFPEDLCSTTLESTELSFSAEGRSTPGTASDQEEQQVSLRILIHGALGF
jgi:hypothetical protein